MKKRSKQVTIKTVWNFYCCRLVHSLLLLLSAYLHSWWMNFCTEQQFLSAPVFNKAVQLGNCNKWSNVLYLFDVHPKPDSSIVFCAESLNETTNFCHHQVISYIDFKSILSSLIVFSFSFFFCKWFADNPL